MMRYACNSSSSVIMVGHSAFFYKQVVRNGFDSTRRWTLSQQLFDHGKLLLIPVCEGCHWFLVVVHLAAGTLVVVDSLALPRDDDGRRHGGALDTIRSWLRAELAFRCITRWDSCRWDAQWASVNMQDNAYDCGLFLIPYSQAIVRGGFGEMRYFNQSHCVEKRLSILNRVLDGDVHDVHLQINGSDSDSEGDVQWACGVCGAVCVCRVCAVCGSLC